MVKWREYEIHTVHMALLCIYCLLEDKIHRCFFGAWIHNSERARVIFLKSKIGIKLVSETSLHWQVSDLSCSYVPVDLVFFCWKFSSLISLALASYVLGRPKTWLHDLLFYPMLKPEPLGRNLLTPRNLSKNNI